MRALRLVACVSVVVAGWSIGDASTGEPDAAPDIRIVFPTADTILYGAMPVRVEAKTSLPYRVVEPMPEGRHLVILDSRQDGVREHKWLRDFKPHRLLVEVWEGDRWVAVPSSEVWTAGFPRPDASAHATVRGPSFTEIEIGSTPPLEEALANLDPANPESHFDCTVGGRDCRVIRVERIREGGALYVTLLIDGTDSMYEFAHPWTIIKSVTAFVSAMRAMPFKTYMRMVSFSDYSTDLTPGYTEDIEELRTAIGHFSELNSKFTCLYQAVNRELRRIALRRESTVLAGNPSQFAMMVWTDGKQNCRTGFGDSTVSSSWISRASAPIFPIAVNSPPGILRSLASASGGQCFDAQTMVPEKIFGEDIARFLSTRYRVRLELPRERRSGSLTLRVRGRDDIRLFHQDALTEGPKILDTAEQVLDRSVDLDELENAAWIVGRQTTAKAGKMLRSALARLVAWNLSLVACHESDSSGGSANEWQASLESTCGGGGSVAEALRKNLGKCGHLSGPLVSTAAVEGSLGALDGWSLERVRRADPSYAENYDRFRTAVLVSIEEMTGRALLWETDVRLQREWLEFLDQVLSDGLPLCEGTRKFLDLFTWPDFPSDPKLKETAKSLCRIREARKVDRFDSQATAEITHDRRRAMVDAGLADEIQKRAGVKISR